MSDPGTNTSATGGPMRPNNAPAPLEGNALSDLFQETLVALTGIDSNFVRPRYQTNPPNVPDSGIAWMSFYIKDRPSDTFPLLEHDGAGDGGLGVDKYQRMEELVMLCSFYDDGVNGQAYALAAALRDSITVPQNMEALEAQNIYLAYTGGLVPLPSLLKELWLFRVDLEIRFRRQVDRTYRVRNLISAQVELIRAGGGAIGEFVVGVSPIGGPAPVVIDIEE